MGAFELSLMTCPDCNGMGIDLMDGEWQLGEREFTCLRCMGVGEVEIQRGPQP